MASIKGYALKELKTMEGKEGDIIRCTITKNGKNVAEFFDDGWGGEPEVTMVGTMKYDEFIKDLKSLTPFYRKRTNAIGIDYGFSIEYNVGLLVGDLRNLLIVENQYKKNLKSYAQKYHSGNFRLGCVVLWSDTQIGFKWVPFITRTKTTEQQMEKIGKEMQDAYVKQNGTENRTIVEYYYSLDDFQLLKESA